MYNRIESDRSRFHQIVRGKIKKDLKKYVKSGEMIGRKGKNLVSIPIPQIELPSFRYGDNLRQGVGQGDGERGTPIAAGPDEGFGAGEAPGRHLLEVEVTLEELAQILGETLALPNIQPRGKKNLQGERDRYNRIRRVGPSSLRHFKRTYRSTLKRMIASGAYDPGNPVVVPVHEDMRYRGWTRTPRPENNAVVLYMMDVSGSMGSEQKEIVRIEAFWIDVWLKHQYKSIQTRYIVHDAAAKEVDEYTFYHLRESGGTKISSAYELAKKMIEEHYPPSEWNIYPFHFSDGDNWGGDDTRRCLDLLTEDLLPKVNLFCYGQVRSAYGSGQFKNDLDGRFGDDERVRSSDIQDRDGILESIREFLGTGR
ncbi:MAG: DUF444 family protein [Planctomycetes bacterium]|nr:DUF444 family protein [Planctomycetota bacterium]